MAWEPVRIFPATMAAGATLTAEIDIKNYYQVVRLLVPTHASATDWYVQGCEESGGTFRRIAHVAANTASVQLNDFRIASGISNRLVEIPGVNFQYIKIEASTANTAQVGLKLICGG